MANSKKIIEQGAEIIPIEVAKIRPHPNNPRSDVGDISELTESIRANGILQNLTVVPDEEPEYFRCLIGHRRLVAAKSAGLKTVPCAVSRNMPLADQVATMLAENMHRQNLTDTDKMNGVQMMLDLGDTVDKICERTNFSRKKVDAIMYPLTFNNKDEVKKAVEEREASIWDFQKLKKIKDPQTREKLVQYMGTNNFNWELESAVKGEKIVEFLDSFAEKIDKPDAAKMAFEKGYGDPERLEKPAGFSPDKKYYYVYSHGYGQVYEEKSKDKTEEKQKTSDAEYERKKAEAELAVRLEKLIEIKKRMEKRRDDFIRNFSYTGKKSAEPDFVHGLELIQMENLCGGNGVVTGTYTNLCRLLGIEDGRGDIMDALIAENITGTRLSVWLGYICLNTSGSPWNYDLSYDRFTTGRLKILYRFLEACGYEISDEERAFIDGTHELYTKGD